MLSKERAANVRRALISNGIQPSRVNIVGHGDSEFSSKTPNQQPCPSPQKSLLPLPGLKAISKKKYIFTKIKK
ncbi:OmpA family protein [Vibrio chagasii]|nr:OmpA family protein [Vibrio chagasii]